MTSTRVVKKLVIMHVTFPMCVEFNQYYAGIWRMSIFF